MALGVLNNLSAIYAENNLNNTNNSLQTVLQQLSSGSKINSGADDAAGLSLVNGLEANSMALTQSETNATEGVGLLDVADGALSQVTSLLDRAITLATEASNGTLNSTQEGAANQEYQSILAEVSNIGSTTTYNQQQVFTGKDIAVYTGDSSTAGSSLDDLNIHGLSESSVGDTNGVMSYGNGDGSTGTNVFIDLSNNDVNAALGDTLNASGASSIQVTYLKTGANGVVTPTTATVGVGTGTSYANTVQGLMSAIDNSGLGLTATFGHSGCCALWRGQRLGYGHHHLRRGSGHWNRRRGSGSADRRRHHSRPARRNPHDYRGRRRQPHHHAWAGRLHRQHY
jgi:flagellin